MKKNTLLFLLTVGLMFAGLYTVGRFDLGSSSFIAYGTGILTYPPFTFKKKISEK